MWRLRQNVVNKRSNRAPCQYTRRNKKQKKGAVLAAISAVKKDSVEKS